MSPCVPPPPFCLNTATGLNSAFKQWIEKHGSGVFVPFLTTRTEPEFHKHIKKKNNTLPYFELANGQWKLEKPLPFPIWYNPGFRGEERSKAAKATFPESVLGSVTEDMRIGFIANELLDPAACSSSVLESCPGRWCVNKWPQAYLVHQCLNTWRGRIGTTRRRRR